MTGCFVFVEYAFVSDAVDDFNGFLVNCLSSSFVAGFNCFQHFFTAVRNAVRRLALWARCLTDWRARLRACALFAILNIS